jgi:hypothetical protein
MATTYLAAIAAKIDFEIGYIMDKRADNMACFCGCETYVKDSNGFKVGCVKCSHGPQNHEESFKLKPVTEGSQKRGSLN